MQMFSEEERQTVDFSSSERIEQGKKKKARKERGRNQLDSEG